MVSSHTKPHKAHPRPTLWVFLLIFWLSFAPTYAKASAFDSIMGVIVPWYQKITGKTPTQESTPSAPQDPAPTKSETQPTIAAPPILQSPSHTRTPDLLTILLAEFAYDRGDTKTALDLYQSQAFKQNAAAVFERALDLSMQIQTPAESLAFSKNWQDQNPDHTPAWFYTTHLALLAEDYKTVSQNLRQILEDDPKVDLGQIFLGFFPKDQSALRTLFYELQSLDNDENTSLLVLKAGLLVQMNEPTAAILYLDGALQDDPNNLAHYILKADILKQQAPYPNTDLRTFLTQSQARTTGNTQKQLYLYHVRYLIDQGDLAGAWAILQSIYPAYPDDHELSMLAALVALDVQEYQTASAILQPLTTVRTIQDEAYYYLGISLERRHDYTGAKNAFAKVRSLQFVWSAAQKIVAIDLNQNDADAAIRHLQYIRNQFDIYADESYILQADILLKQNKKPQAQALLAQAYQQFPDDTALLYASTRLLDNQADFDQKLNNLQRLLTLEPTNPAYLLDKAELILSATPNDPESLETATQISQDTQYDHQVQLQALHILAKHALSLQDYAAVLEYLELPYQLTPTLNLGITLLRAYQGLGDTRAAVALLQDLQQRFGQ